MEDSTHSAINVNSVQVMSTSLKLDTASSNLGIAFTLGAVSGTGILYLGGSPAISSTVSRQILIDTINIAQLSIINSVLTRVTIQQIGGANSVASRVELRGGALLVLPTGVSLKTPFVRSTSGNNRVDVARYVLPVVEQRF